MFGLILLYLNCGFVVVFTVVVVTLRFVKIFVPISIHIWVVIMKCYDKKYLFRC